MVKPLPLDKLPKAGRIRSIRFRRTTPGNFTRLKIPQSASKEGALVDPSHPWAKQHPRNYANELPRHQSQFLTIQAFPKALLSLPETPLPSGEPFGPSPPTPYGKDDGRLIGGRKMLNMSMMLVMSKKSVHKRAVVRNRLKNRLKSVVGLLVTHDADVRRTEDGNIQIVTTESDDGEKWVMQDWTYVFTPTLEIYRMPLPELLSIVRTALSKINAECRKLEYTWTLQAHTSPSSKPKYSKPSRSSSSTRLRDGQGRATRIQRVGQGVADSSKKKTRLLEDSELDTSRLVTKRINVRALLKPYASASAELIDDDLFIEDEEDEDSYDDDGLDTDEEDEVDAEGIVNLPPHMKLIKARLPPRRSQPPSAPPLFGYGEKDLDSDSDPAAEVDVGVDLKNDTTAAGGGEKEDQKRESVVKALFSKKPIFKPEKR